MPRAAMNDRSDIVFLTSGESQMEKVKDLEKVKDVEITKKNFVTVDGRSTSDPPENCHLTVKKLPKT